MIYEISMAVKMSMLEEHTVPIFRAEDRNNVPPNKLISTQVHTALQHA
jgi:hypothetical protein